MTEQNQKQLGKTLWNIADQLRGAMNADDFRDYMLAFLFLRYLSDNYEAGGEEGAWARTIPTRTPSATAAGRRCRSGTQSNPDDVVGVREADAAQGALRHQARAPLGQHRPPGPHAERRAAQHAAGGVQVHRERIVREHLPGPVLGDQSRLGQAGEDSTPTGTRSSARSSRKIAEGLAEFSTDTDTLGDAYEYLIGQFAAGLGQEGGRVLHAAADFGHPLGDRHARQPGAEDRQAEAAGERVGLRLRLRLAAA